MLLPRTVSALVLGPLSLALVYFGYPYFHVGLVLISAGMIWEFTRMDGRVGQLQWGILALSSAAAVAAMTVFGAIPALAIVLFATLTHVTSDQVRGLPGVRLVHSAVAYVTLPAIALVFLRAAGGMILVFWLLAVVWATDIGAYVCGRLIGGPRLAPSISPKKTWAGAIGGLLAGVGVSVGLMAAFHHPWGLTVTMAAVVVSIATESGDLLESALKRWYDVKDSGTLIPGHGGLMDRLDGLWAAAPVAALICVGLNGGVERW